jgi:TP901 family phage tail tape measure protein
MADRALRFDLLGRDKTLGRTLTQAEGKFKRFGGSALKMGAAVSGAFGGVALIGGLKSAVSAAATFDKTMRQVAAVTKVPISQMKDLRKVALDMGAKTSFSAKQASEAMLALGKGGLSFAQMKAGALSSTLTLAAAGGLELGDAAEFVVQGLKTFGLRADKAATVAAALAGAANASTASVEDMGLALSQTGAGARNAGLNIQETAGVLALFADNGIRGSDAGTSLKTMLSRLVPQTEKAKNAMADLGLKFTDAHGAILPISEISDRLRAKLGGLSDAQRTTALSTIFGSDATRAATILMRSGSRGLDRYIKATSDRAAAEKLAKTNTEGAAGAFERLKGAIETVSIQIGDKLLPAFASIAEGLSKGITDAFKALEESVDVQVFVATAKAWATVIIRGFKNALKTGDWGSLGAILQKILGKAIGNGAALIRKAFGGVDWDETGRVLGEGLRKAIGNGVDLFKRAFGGVDWLNVGKEVGKGSGAFAVGFVPALLDGIVDTLIAHPMDALKLAAAIIPVGRFGGAIAKIISKIPLLKHFAGLFRGLETVTGPANRAIDKIVGAIGKGFVEGFTRVFPRASKLLRGRIDDMLAWISLRAEAFRNAGVRLIKSLSVGVGEQFGLVVKNIGQVIRLLTRPFITAGRWLLRAGGWVVTGLIRGVEAVGRGLGRVALRVISWLTTPFRPAARWLVAGGRWAVGGLIRGITSMYGRARTAVGGLVGVIRQVMGRVVSAVAAPFRTARTLINRFLGGVESIGTKIGLSKGWLSFRIPAFQQGGVVGMKRGGGVPGSGSGDKVRALLEPGEVVIPNRTQDRRRLLRDPKVRKRLGDIGGDPDALVIRMQKGGMASRLTGLVGRVQNFIRSTDPLPYAWGGVGPNAYDCSGLAGEIVNRLTGRPSFRRLFTTSSIGSGVAGLRPGRGTFTIGTTPGTGHMAANLAGLGAEARSTRTGIFTGSAARSVTSFARQFYLPQVGGNFVNTGGVSFLDLASKLVKSLLGRLTPGLGGIKGGSLGQLLRAIARKLFDAGKNKLLSGVFDSGGVLPPHSTTLATNRTSRPERVLGPSEPIRLHPDSIRALAAELRANPPVVSVVDLKAGINRQAGRVGQPPVFR